jgi:hypothetical protein
MFIIEDKITDQIISRYSADSKGWDWDEVTLQDDYRNETLYSNVHIFDTRVEAEAAMFHLEKVFQSNGHETNFRILQVKLVSMYKIVQSK